MKLGSLVIVLVLVSTVLAGPYITFDQFITKFKKNYTKGTEEYNQKQKIYNFNVHQLEAKNCSECGVTKFFDMPSEQFNKKILNLQLPQTKVSANAANTPQLAKVGAPPYLDWRTQNVITSIKDQGDCGCCWSFATCALAESFLIMKRVADQGIDFSEQYFLKCTPQGDCQGGYIENTLKVLTSVGVPPDSTYPYRPFSPSSPAICQNAENSRLINVRPKSFYDLSDNQIKNLLTVSPLAIAIDSTDWQYYSGGTWKCKPTGKVNHAVLLVGYTADGRWIIKNQWGTDWGENGYIYVTMAPGYNCKIGVALHMLEGDNVQLVKNNGATGPYQQPTQPSFGFFRPKSEYMLIAIWAITVLLMISI